MTWLEKKEKQAEKRGEKRGAERGEERGEKRLLLDLIGARWSKRFGPMPVEVSQRLQKAPEPGRLRHILNAILDSRSEAEALAEIAAQCPSP